MARNALHFDTNLTASELLFITPRTQLEAMLGYMNRVTTEVQIPTHGFTTLDPPLSARPRCPSDWAELRDRSSTPKRPEWAIKRILLATDYSSASSQAIRKAVDLANQHDALLTILHVIDVNAPSQPGRAADFMQRLLNDASAQMANLAYSLSGQVDAQTTIAEGLPWEVVVDKSSEFDLVIIAEGNRRRSSNLFSKHTVRRVIENAACPVLVIRP